MTGIRWMANRQLCASRTSHQVHRLKAIILSPLQILSYRPIFASSPIKKPEPQLNPQAETPKHPSPSEPRRAPRRGPRLKCAALGGRGALTTSAKERGPRERCITHEPGEGRS